MRKRAAAVALALLAAAGRAGGREPSVTARLVGTPGLVGVRFTMPRGVHIYWKNPGEAGLPTRIGFGLPKGYRAGSLRWPMPERFVQPGGITGFGYEREVVVWAGVAGGGEIPAGARVTAAVKWLECDSVECVQGRADLATVWPPEGLSGFPEKWEVRCPEAAGTARPAGEPGKWEIGIPWAGRRGSVKWLVADDPSVEVRDVEVRAGDPVRITCTIAPAPGTRMPPGGVGVLAAYKPLWGGTRGVLVEVPASGSK